GTIYVQESRFKARRVGGAYVARNVSRYLDTVMSDWPAAFQPLVYCWRGGMRSNAMAVILAQVGWRTSVLSGGYRTYRRRVVQRLYDGASLDKVVLIDGHTGAGKTEVLQRLGEHGVQVIDLEGLAEHRGSLLGALPGRPQPSQKLFESRLLAAIERLDPERPVLIEAESSKVGERVLPPAVWSAMTGAPRIELVAPAPERARYLAATYAELGHDAETLIGLLSRLPDRPGRKRLEAWTGLVRGGALEELAAGLMEAHYDPAYRRSSRQHERATLGTVHLERLDGEGFAAAAKQVAELTVGR
ncbi:MAG TPA: tRNA 2-selenouridine(34) synthase MnmH, partial [Caulobacteraceae bacterium]